MQEHLNQLSVARRPDKKEELPQRTALNPIELIIPDNWPSPLAEEAYHGLTGDIVKAIEPHTEADSAALLSQFLTMFGSVIGRGPHCLAEADRHGLNLFISLVGESAKGRKGTSRAHIKRLFEAVDNHWTVKCISHGLSSGEGLIWAVRDPIEEDRPKRENGQIVGSERVLVDSGIEDKRLLIMEGELASALRVLGRDGNTLSAVIRNAWDGETLRIMTKNSAAEATGSHISIIGHITKDELLRYLSSTESANGFANRFLWFCSKRSKLLPEGGHIYEEDFSPLIQRLKGAIDYARRTGEIARDEAARAIWCKVYPDLSEGKPGLFGAVTGRSEAQVMRLSALYALLDQSNVVRREHILASLAVWQYAENSARYIFGGSLGDPFADRILKALRAIPEGKRKAEISGLFGRNTSAPQIDRALKLLEERGLAKCEREKSGNGGRPAERWLAKDHWDRRYPRELY